MTERPIESGHRLRGTVLMVLGGVCLSTGGPVIRTVEQVDPWAILFYRAIGLVVLLSFYLYWRHRSRTFAVVRDVGWAGVVMAMALGGGFACYVFGVLNTTIANVSFIISAGPLVAALLGWLILRERVAGATWVVIGGALCGMALMFAEGLRVGGMTGNVIALGVPLSFGVMLIVIRGAGLRDMVPATLLSGVFAGFLGFVFADNLDVSTGNLALLLWLGVGQIGAGFLLYTIGARYLPPAEAALLALTEPILGPIWAWLFLHEVPGPLSLTGGLIVLGCVFWQGYRSLVPRRVIAAA